MVPRPYDTIRISPSTIPYGYHTPYGYHRVWYHVALWYLNNSAIGLWQWSHKNLSEANRIAVNKENEPAKGEANRIRTMRGTGGKNALCCSSKPRRFHLCVCVCVRATQRERELKRERECVSEIKRVRACLIVSICSSLVGSSGRCVCAERHTHTWRQMRTARQRLQTRAW